MEKEDVLIVKMDATANDVPPLFEVRGYVLFCFMCSFMRIQDYVVGYFCLQIPNYLLVAQE